MTKSSMLLFILFLILQLNLIKGKRVKATKSPINKPSKSPTTVGCTSFKDSTMCASAPEFLSCEWVVLKDICDPFTNICNEFVYGCQEKSNFCNLKQGNKIQRQVQCTIKRYPCFWTNKGSGSCAVRTGSPTVVNTNRDPWSCFNTCFTPYNGICEDGGPNSSSGLCIYGSDCADCGMREPKTRSPTRSV